jgi:hypothetical protein
MSNMDIKKLYLIEKGTKLPKYNCKYLDCNYCIDLKNCEVWKK